MATPAPIIPPPPAPARADASQTSTSESPLFTSPSPASSLQSSSSSSSTSSSSSPSTSRMPSRNPIPLSAAQEHQVRELYHKRVRQKCDDQIREFAECATGRTVSMSWACRDKKNAMQNCMIGYATTEEQDRAREEWFATRLDRARERAEREEERKRQKRAKQEYWGLDENDRPIKR